MVWIQNFFSPRPVAVQRQKKKKKKKKNSVSSYCLSIYWRKMYTSELGSLSPFYTTITVTSILPQDFTVFSFFCVIISFRLTRFSILFRVHIAFFVSLSLIRGNVFTVTSSRIIHKSERQIFKNFNLFYVTIKMKIIARTIHAIIALLHLQEQRGNLTMGTHSYCLSTISSIVRDTFHRQLQ